MAKSDPPFVPLADMTSGQFAQFFALLVEKSRSQTRDGKPFFACRFRDRARTAGFMAWADGGWFDACQDQWRVGRAYRIEAVYGDHGRYGPQLEIHAIREASDADRADGFDPSDLVPRSRFDSSQMYTELVELVQRYVENRPLQRLVLTLLEQHRAALQVLPATSRRFYPFAGGLLEHILSVTRSCIYLADYYRTRHADLRPPINRDLVVAGAVLHDIGRLCELDCQSFGTEPTVRGRLFGHLILGRDLVRQQAAEQGDVDPELLQLLEHIILTHLALPSWGSPRLPLVPECLILHHADDLDAKMEMYVRCLRDDQEPGPFTARDPGIGRPLLKERSQ